MKYTYGSKDSNNIHEINKNGKAFASLVFFNPEPHPEEQIRLVNKMILGLNGFNAKLSIEVLQNIINCLCDQEPNTPKYKALLEARIAQLSGEGYK